MNSALDLICSHCNSIIMWQLIFHYFIINFSSRNKMQMLYDGLRKISLCYGNLLYVKFSFPFLQDFSLDQDFSNCNFFPIRVFSTKTQQHKVWLSHEFNLHIPWIWNFASILFKYPAYMNTCISYFPAAPEQENETLC